jgi:PTS system nitrogen regulatory IIA component
MDLKIEDVAELTGVSEEIVRRWVAHGKIPAYRLHEEYRFNRDEIENWMIKSKLLPIETEASESEESFSSLNPSGMQHFSLYRAIHRGGVQEAVAGRTKEELICAATLPIAQTLQLDPEVLSELLLDRESLMPTALGHGVAVPHCRECLEQIPFDLVSVVFPAQPIEYGALNGEPVHTLFFLFASSDKVHLQLLAKIAHLSLHPQALGLLQRHPTKTALLEFIREWEGALRL